MYKKTNSKKIKEIAVMLLNIKPQADKKYPFIIRHPFFNTPAFPIQQENGELRIFDIMNPESFAQACAFLEKKIWETKNPMHLFMMVNTPYMPLLFKYCHRYLGERDYEYIMRFVWQMTEFPNHDSNMSVEEFAEAFEHGNPAYLMNAKECELLSQLPDEVTIFRGCYSTYEKALSWTLSKKKAVWFSQRFSDKGNVYQAVIDKSDILAYFDSEEQEIIPKLDKIRNIKQIEAS